MALVALLGLVIGFAVVILGMGETVCLSGDWRSLLVVGVGGIAATMIAYPPAATLNAVRLAFLAVFARPDPPSRIIEAGVGLAEISRRRGVLALQWQLPADPFFAAGIRLAVDGTEPRLIVDILETELVFIEERHKQGHRVLESLGRNWALFGGIGVALVLLTRAGDGISAMELVRQAAYPALQGLVLAGLVAWPLGRRLTELHHMEMLAKRMCIEAVMAIQSGDDPRLIEHKLAVFLAPGDRPQPQPPPGESEPESGTPDDELVAAVEQLTADQEAVVIDHIRQIAADRADREWLEGLAERAESGELGTIPLLAALDSDLRSQILQRVRAPAPGAAAVSLPEIREAT